MMTRRIPTLDELFESQAFTAGLEERARKLVRHARHDRWEASPLAGIAAEIALTLDQIDQTRILHHEIRRSLLRGECYVRTDYLRLMSQHRTYQDEWFVERQILKDRLRAVEKERRNLAHNDDATLQNLQVRLLSLMNQHAQLRFPDNGH